MEVQIKEEICYYRFSEQVYPACILATIGKLLCKEKTPMFLKFFLYREKSFTIFVIKFFEHTFIAGLYKQLHQSSMFAARSQTTRKNW